MRTCIHTYFIPVCVCAAVCLALLMECTHSHTYCNRFKLHYSCCLSHRLVIRAVVSATLCVPQCNTYCTYLGARLQQHSVLLLSQNGSTSLQLPSAWQDILSGPLSLYPVSHEKFTSLLNCTPLIVLIPFSKVGGGGGPHSTTTKKTHLTL